MNVQQRLYQTKQKSYDPRESEKRGKSIAEIGRAMAPSNEERNTDYNDPRRGMKKGGLASKKKK